MNKDTKQSDWEGEFDNRFLPIKKHYGNPPEDASEEIKGFIRDLLAKQHHDLKAREPKGYDRDTIICICCKKAIPNTETYTRFSYKFTFDKNNEGLCKSCSSQDLAVAHQEARNTSKYREHEIRESIKHDLKEQVLEAVGEPIELKTPLTVNYTDMEIKKLLTENELREEIKERIEAVFGKEI